MELFDLTDDPHEMTNLAAHGADHNQLIAELSHRMGTLIRDEIGAAEDGRYLPDTPGMSRAVTAFKNIEPTEPHRPEPAICWTGDTGFAASIVPRVSSWAHPIRR